MLFLQWDLHVCSRDTAIEPKVFVCGFIHFDVFFEYINSTVDSQHKFDLVVNRQIGVGPRDPASMMEYVSVHLRR